MKQCWAEHARDRPSFDDITASMETLMSRDTPYLDVMEVDVDVHMPPLVYENMEAQEETVGTENIA